jgi:5'-nucleotidase
MAPLAPVSGRPVGQQVLIGLALLLILILIPIILVSPPQAKAPAPGQEIHVKILAINDFHGQLPEGQALNREPAGSIPVLATYLGLAQSEGNPTSTFIALPGDIVGASPPESGLLLDEPSMLFFNGYANSCCGQTAPACTGGCNMIATFGNHEFDKGTGELVRKLNGGNGTTTITHMVDPYPGTKASYIASNVVWKSNSTTLVPPYVIRDAGGAKIAFIGADTIKTPSLVLPGLIDEVRFLDEAESINRYVPEIQKQGVHAIVVILHEGGSQDAYAGPTRGGTNVTGSIAGMVSRLDPDVDVVLSGHTHAFTNAYLNNSGGTPVLVTQAWSYSRAFADVDIVIDPATGEITKKTAQIVPAYADKLPGTRPDPAASLFLAKTEAIVSPITSQVVAVAATDITMKENDAGESQLGDLLADSQRSVMETDIAFITTGTLRADIARGNVTWGDLFQVQPFSATIMSMTLTGDQVHRALERQWETPLPPHNLAVSGLTYTYDATKPAGSRVTGIRINGAALEPGKTYTAAMADYLVSGGDGYTVFTKGTGVTSGKGDVDVLAAYMGSLPQPVTPGPLDRITRSG